MSKSLETILGDLTKEIGKDVKALHTKTGDLSNLNTDYVTNTANTNIVSALNYTLGVAKAASASGVGAIDDSAGLGTLNKTYSANKITLSLNAINSILGNSSDLAHGNEGKTVVENLNRIQQAVTSLANATSIDDTSASPTKTYSSTKITQEIERISQGKIDTLVGSAPGTLDTIAEIAQQIEANQPAVQAIGNKVPFNEVKVLTSEQVQNVWTTLNIGVTTMDLVAVYNSAKS